jgi:hypothetical protein
MVSIEEYLLSTLNVEVWSYSGTRVLIVLHNGERSLVFIGLAYQGKDIVFRFNIEYSGLRDFGP